jgi:hypothetical protein
MSGNLSKIKRHTSAILRLDLKAKSKRSDFGEHALGGGGVQERRQLSYFATLAANGMMRDE